MKKIEMTIPLPVDCVGNIVEFIDLVETFMNLFCLSKLTKWYFENEHPESCKNLLFKTKEINFDTKFGVFPFVYNLIVNNDKSIVAFYLKDHFPNVKKLILADQIIKPTSSLVIRCKHLKELEFISPRVIYYKKYDYVNIDLGNVEKLSFVYCEDTRRIIDNLKDKDNIKSLEIEFSEKKIKTNDDIMWIKEFKELESLTISQFVDQMLFYHDNLKKMNVCESSIFWNTTIPFTKLEEISFTKSTINCELSEMNTLKKLSIIESDYKGEIPKNLELLEVSGLQELSKIKNLEIVKKLNIFLPKNVLEKSYNDLLLKMKKLKELRIETKEKKNIDCLQISIKFFKLKNLENITFKNFIFEEKFKQEIILCKKNLKFINCKTVEK